MCIYCNLHFSLDILLQMDVDHSFYLLLRSLSSEHMLSRHAAVSGHLGCFQCFAMRNNAKMNGPCLYGHQFFWVYMQMYTCWVGCLLSSLLDIAKFLSQVYKTSL